YQRIFNKLRLNVIMAEADVGQIGGSMSHEFIALTDYGEAKVAYCENCGYAANAEIVLLQRPDEEQEEEKPMEKVHTPDVHTIQELAEFLNVPPSKIMKAVLYMVNEKEPILVLIRGDREIDENKLEKIIGTDNFRLAKDEEVMKLLGTKKGFIGIFNLPEGIKVLWDNSLYGVKNLVVALNEPDWHYINVNPRRDFQYGNFVDVAQVKENDPCPKCGSPLKVKKGLELGHIFLLGTRYSEPMKAYFTDRDGKEKPIIMGCYGIGISRIISALVEQYHDDKGIKWPTPVAPFELDIILLNTKDEQQKQVAEKLYMEAEEKGIDVIYDDREESPGFKFADADLVGFPYRIVVGKKVKEGKVEVQSRMSGEKWDVEIDKAIDFVKEKIEEDKR
ncbi:MAG TPA: proline--tRNA ligase, partial [Aquifex aeolicus]|nr:proline--tRNA ligase [Aquifex aeolicus]